MSRREEYLRQLEQSKENTISSVSNNAVDHTVREIEEKRIKQEIKSKQSHLLFEQKEMKTVKKTFLFRASLDKKIKDMAKENRVSENEVVSKILEQYFKES